MSQIKPKLALLIGINYTGSEAELNGCINDVHKIKTFLIDHCQYEEQNIKLLTDDTEIKPTANDILNELGKIIVKARDGETTEIFIHFSGHGTYMHDDGNDEDDMKDEAIVPIDYQTQGLITDDLLHDYFAYLPEECKCICLFDCCHSGTILDLKYRYVGRNSRVIENKNSETKGNIVMISGCRDDQTSADAVIKQNWAGAMTYAFLAVIKKYKYNITCFHLLNGMRYVLKKRGFTQLPQICSSHKILNTTLFARNNSPSDPYMNCN